MQSEVPSLPVVYSDKHTRLSRKLNAETASVSNESKNYSSSKNTAHVLQKKKSFHPLLDSPYRNSGRFYPLSQQTKATKNPVGQRVISAKMLRIKQLQNQLTDAHFHLNNKNVKITLSYINKDELPKKELSNENKLLKAIQKKQESALKRYEGANAELPRIINSHHEELRILQVKYKRLKEQNKNTCDILKEKENELHSLQSVNKRLLQLSKDRNLGEREKLQMQVADLTYQIQQQQETIQTLNKKLALESKSLKQQINSEVAKHKETQRHLQETMDKLRSLEDLLDNRERRLYYNNQLNIFSKGKSIGNHSIASFGDSSASFHFSKLASGNKKFDNETLDKVLPNLTNSELSSDRKGNNKLPPNGTCSSSSSEQFVPKTETMASLQHIRKFKLPKSGSSRINSASSKNLKHQDEFESSSRLSKAKESDLIDFAREIEKPDFSEKRDDDKLPKTIVEAFEFTNIDEDSELNDTNTDQILQSEILAKKSRELHARLTYAVHENIKTPNELSQVKKNQHIFYNDIEKMVQEELKLGQESVARISETEEMFAAVDLQESASSLEEMSDVDSELDIKSPRNTKTNSNGDIYKNLINEEELMLNFTARPELSSRFYEDPSEKKTSEDYQRHRYSVQNTSKPRNTISLTNTKFFRFSENIEERKMIQSSRSAGDLNIDEIENSVFNEFKFNTSPTKTLANNAHFEDTVKSQNWDKEIQKDNEIIKAAVSENLKQREKLNIYLETNRAGGDSIAISKTRRGSLDRQGSKTKENTEPKEGIKSIGFNKEKLLAAMKAIDNNENIEYFEQKSRRNSATNVHRSQITENLYRGVPTHSKKKDDIANGMLENGKLDTKIRRGSCGKLH